MDSKLKIISYNCQSFNIKGPLIKSLMEKCDLICLQETFVTDCTNSCYDNFHNDFVSAYTPAVRKSETAGGRPSGGLCIYWRKNLDINFIPVQITSRLLGLEIKFGNLTYFLVNIYCCYDNGYVDSLIEYKSIMADLANICNSQKYDEIIVCGDYNADPTKNSRFFKELESFLDAHYLVANDIKILPKTSYTYVSPNAVSGTSFIDHVVVSKTNLTVNHKILYGTTFYDHIPISFDLIIPGTINRIIPPIEPSLPQSCFSIPVAWDKVTPEIKKEYCLELDHLALEIWDDVLSCRNESCNMSSHTDGLNKLYSMIFEAISISSELLPKYNNNEKNHIVIGWNNYCKNKYSNARHHYMLWHEGGKPRNGLLFENMKLSRSDFKGALKYCRNNEMKIRKENLLAKLNSTNKSLFWKEVRKIKGKNSNLLAYIDGKSDPKKIAKLFDSKYKNILNDPASCVSSDVNSLPVQDTNIDEELSVQLISMNDVIKAIDKINLGLGWDKIHANHLKFAGPIFKNLLCKLFNKFLSHKFVPRTMIEGEIRPIFKNNCTSKTDSSNYRPVMNSSNILKVFENCIQPYLSNHLKLSNLQFGYRNNTSCNLAVTVLNETVENYISGNSNVHCCVIDVSKAFDKINYEILLHKLRQTNLPRSIVNILDYMLNNTFVNLRCNNTVTDHWKVSNGARQGGCLSPLLFSFYVNDMIREISAMNTGCSLAGIRTNIICFADDMFLLGPTAQSLQKLIVKLADSLKSLCFSVNEDKCKYIVFKKHDNDVVSTVVSLNGFNIERIKFYKYLGIILSDDRSITRDVDRAANAFIKQFNGMYSKFYYMNDSVLHYLFRTYTSSFYGVELWHGSICYRHIDKISIIYHKAVKRIARLNVWDSNHEACEIVGIPIFKHLIAMRAINFFHQMLKSSSPCIAPYRHYLRYHSHMFFRLDKLFFKNYQVKDFIKNPLCALLARIKYVQSNEPRRRRNTVI